MQHNDPCKETSLYIEQNGKKINNIKSIKTLAQVRAFQTDVGFNKALKVVWSLNCLF